MLTVTCQAGENRYAIDARHVAEVVSTVRLEAVPGAPPWLAGYFVYRGRATPAVDLTRLVTGSPCPSRYSSRMIVVEVPTEGGSRPLALLAEWVATAELDCAAEPGDPRREPDMGMFGPIFLHEQGMFQLVDLARLLPHDRRIAIFHEAAEAR